MDQSQHLTSGIEKLAKSATVALAMVAAFALAVYLFLDSAPAPFSVDSDPSALTSVPLSRAPGFVHSSMGESFPGKNNQLGQQLSDGPAGVDESAIQTRPGATLIEYCARSDTGLECSFSGDPAVVAAGMSREMSRGILAGSVVTAAGVGLGNLEIVATPERHSDHNTAAVSGHIRFRTRTDGLGNFRLEELPAGVYELRSSARGDFRSARISARVGSENARLVVRRGISLVVEGRVTTDGGAALEGVDVLPALLGQPSMQSDRDGNYRLSLAVEPELDQFTIRFRRPGYKEHAIRLARDTAEDSRIVVSSIAMQPVELWSSVAGRVVDAGNRPVTGLSVELSGSDSGRFERTLTDIEGRFEFPAVEAPAAYRLTVLGGDSHRDVQMALNTSATSPEVTGSLELVTEAFDYGSLRGRVISRDGAPVSKLDLVLRNEQSRQPSQRFRTDEHGNFSLTSVPAGKLVIASQSDPAFLVQGVSLDKGEDVYLPLTLDWGVHRIRGTVVDADNQPVPASSVILQWSEERDGITSRATRRAATDAQGQFAFNNLGPGPHAIRIRAPGFSPVNLEHDLTQQGYQLMVRLN